MSAGAGHRPGLVRALGFYAAAAMMICSIIGQGVFLKARAMTCNVGSPELVLATWIAAGILTLCGALTFAELGAMIPASGGPYAFLRRAFGAPVAFAYGWMQLFLGGPLGSAALAAGAAIFLNLLSGDALDRIHLPFSMLSLHGNLSGAHIAALAVLAVVALINLAPVGTNGAVATALAVVKIVMVAGLAISAFALGSGSWAHFAMSGAAGTCEGIAPAARGGAAGFGAAMLGALYAYNGWAFLTYVAGEIKSPGVTLPRAVVAGMFVVIGLYTAANAAYFYVLSPAAVASVPTTSSVGVQVFGELFGGAARGVAAVLLLISVIATLQVGLLYNSRVAYAFGSDGIFLPWLSAVSAATHVPARAVLAFSSISALFILLGTFDVLSDFSIFSYWIFYGLTGASLFVLRRREPGTPRPYRTFGYPIVPAIFVLATIWLLVETAIASPARSFIGLGFIALALPVYWFSAKRRRPAINVEANL